MKKGRKAVYRVRVTNRGNAAATRVNLKVNGKGIASRASVGKIAGGKTRRVKVKAKKPGKVKVKFKVNSKNAGGKTVKKTITVKK